VFHAYLIARPASLPGEGRFNVAHILRSLGRTTTAAARPSRQHRRLIDQVVNRVCGNRLLRRANSASQKV
jgi:hypothetical protein